MPVERRPTGARQLAHAALLVFAIAAPASAADAAAAELAGVSPGSVRAFEAVGQSCPTFSWTAAAAARRFELAVYRLSESGKAASEPALLSRLPRGATSWTPSLGRCLPAGRYGWSVGFEPPEGAPVWSETLLFEIVAPRLDPSGAVGSDRRPGVSRERSAGASREAEAASRIEVPRPRSASSPGQGQTADAVAMLGQIDDPTGVTRGVVGIVHSPDGAALAADNVADGTDLLLDGPTPTAVTEAGLYRSSPSGLTFDFENLGGGGLTLRAGGVDVVTTATDRDSLGALACAGGQIAKRSASTWVCAADDGTTYAAGNQLALDGTTFNVTEGAGSGLDADTLDGQQASEIIESASDETRIPIDSVPFTITEPGSYYLTGNLTMTTSDTAIRVLTSHVTIDFGGFVLDGNGLGLHGVEVAIATPDREDVEIRGGSLTGFTDDGIESWAVGTRVVGMRVFANLGGGITTKRRGALIRDCTVVDNGDESDEHGIEVGQGAARIFGNTVLGSAGRGIHEYNTSYSSLILNNNSSLNVGDGIGANNSRVAHNTVFENGGIGIVFFVHSAALIHDNVVVENGQWGIEFSDGTVRNNEVRKNALSGIKHNVFSLSGGRVIDNHVEHNNSAEEVGEAGIVVSGGVFVRGNSVIRNGWANIWATDDGNVIEGNLLFGRGFTGKGLYIQHANNLYADNRARGHTTNFDVVPGNTNAGGNAQF